MVRYTTGISQQKCRGGRIGRDYKRSVSRRGAGARDVWRGSSRKFLKNQGLRTNVVVYDHVSSVVCAVNHAKRWRRWRSRHTLLTLFPGHTLWTLPSGDSSVTTRPSSAALPLLGIAQAQRFPCFASTPPLVVAATFCIPRRGA